MEAVNAKRPGVPRSWVLVNGRYMAALRTTSQESHDKFGIVPWRVCRMEHS